MNNRILEIIEILEERLNKEWGMAVFLMEELIYEGYNEDEIEEAISWIETYQKGTEMEGFFELNKNFLNINLKEDAYQYLQKALKEGLIEEDYFDELLSHCLLKGKTDIDLYKLLTIDRELRSIKHGILKEAKANLRAYSFNKDC